MISIHDRVHARADLDDLRAKRDLDGLAAALNAEGLSEIGSRWVTGRTILEMCPHGEEIIEALEKAAAASVATRWTVGFLENDPGVDVGRPKTIEKIDALVQAQLLSADHAAELKALALHPIIVDRLEVEAALYNRDGTEK